MPSKHISVGREVVGIVGYTSKETPFLSKPGISDFYSTHCLKIDAPNQSWTLFLWAVGKSRNDVWYWVGGVLRITWAKPLWWLPHCPELLCKDIGSSAP